MSFAICYEYALYRRERVQQIACDRPLQYELASPSFMIPFPTAATSATAKYQIARAKCLCCLLTGIHWTSHLVTRDDTLEDVQVYQTHVHESDLPNWQMILFGRWSPSGLKSCSLSHTARSRMHELKPIERCSGSWPVTSPHYPARQLLRRFRCATCTT